MPRKLWQLQALVAAAALIFTLARQRFGVFAATSFLSLGLLYPLFLLAERLAIVLSQKGSLVITLVLGLTFAVMWCLVVLGITSSIIVVLGLAA